MPDELPIEQQKAPAKPASNAANASTVDTGFTGTLKSFARQLLLGITGIRDFNITYS